MEMKHIVDIEIYIIILVIMKMLYSTVVTDHLRSSGIINLCMLDDHVLRTRSLV